MKKFMLSAALASAFLLGSATSPAGAYYQDAKTPPAAEAPAASEEKPAEKIEVKVPADPKTGAAETICELHHHAPSDTYYHQPSDSFYRYEAKTKSYRLSHPGKKGSSTAPAYLLQKNDPRKYE